MPTNIRQQIADPRVTIEFDRDLEAKQGGFDRTGLTVRSQGGFAGTVWLSPVDPSEGAAVTVRPISVWVAPGAPARAVVRVDHFHDAKAGDYRIGVSARAAAKSNTAQRNRPVQGGQRRGSLLRYARQRTLPQIYDYMQIAAAFERHHIVPRFLGGGDEDENIITQETTLHKGITRDMLEFFKGIKDDEGEDMAYRRGKSGEAIQNLFSPAKRIDAIRSFYTKFENKYPDVARKFFERWGKTAAGEPEVGLKEGEMVVEEGEGLLQELGQETEPIAQLVEEVGGP
jgi:hypothetical protein